jgi:protein-disulfide isomerase
LPFVEMRSALENHEFLQRVKDDFMGGARSGVNGTPTFFLNGERYEASWEYDDLVAAINAVLSQGKAEHRRVG